MNSYGEQLKTLIRNFQLNKFAGLALTYIKIRMTKSNTDTPNYFSCRTIQVRGLEVCVVTKTQTPITGGAIDIAKKNLSKVTKNDNIQQQSIVAH